jgi:hypothetical protein
MDPLTRPGIVPNHEDKRSRRPPRDVQIIRAPCVIVYENSSGSCNYYQMDMTRPPDNRLVKMARPPPKESAAAVYRSDFTN